MHNLHTAQKSVKKSMAQYPFEIKSASDSAKAVPNKKLKHYPGCGPSPFASHSHKLDWDPSPPLQPLDKTRYCGNHGFEVIGLI